MLAHGVTIAFLAAASATPGPQRGACTPCSRLFFEGSLQRLSVWNGPSSYFGGLAGGDLNGDGITDVAAAFDSTYILLSGPDGGYARGPVLSPNNGSHYVSIADMDGDGALDVVVGGLALGVTRGDGLGGFHPPLPGVGGPAAVGDLGIADFDGDGRLDVATVHGNAGDLVSIYRGIGGGQVASPTSFPSGGVWPLALTIADYDRDGRVDLAVGNNQSATLAVFLNDGAGGFGAPSVYTLDGIAALDALSADLDGDGDTDIAVAGAGGIKVFAGDGSGGFAAIAGPPPLPPFFISYAIAAADFDGDGALELAFDVEPNAIHVSHREASGAYGQPTVLAIPDGINALIPADINGDGRADLAMATRDGVQFLRPDIGQQYAPRTVSAGNVLRLFGGDFNGDGYDDLFLDDYVVARLWLSDGAFGFTPNGTQLPKGVVASADFNSDGHRDAMTSGSVYLGDGTGHFTPGTSLSLFGYVAGDFNNDSHADVAGVVSSAPSVTVVGVQLGDGNGGFGPPVPTNVPNTFFGDAFARLAAGRFNNDPLLDLTVINSQGSYQLLGNGGGGFTTSGLLGSTAHAEVGSGDFNGDGYADSVEVPNGATGAFLTVRLGGPTGLGPAQYYALFRQGDYVVHVAELNGDGLDDVMASVGNSTRPELALMMGNASGVFRVQGLTVGGGSDVTAGDWNGDGLVDLAVANQTVSALRVLPARRCQPVALGLVRAASSCNTPGIPFVTQPAVAATDAAGSVVCPAGNVTAELTPGSGTPGALLGGATAAPLSEGIASFSNLSVDRPGRGYRLTFRSPGLVPLTSPTFSQGLAPAIEGPSLACPGQPEQYTVGYGYHSYAWTLDGSPAASTPAAVLDVPLGPHTVAVTVGQDTCSADAAHPVTSVLPSVTVASAGATTVCAACTGGLLTASIVASATSPLQWGYRTLTGGPVTNLPGETDTTYRLSGPDFPGPGDYLVVATVACGTTAVSNEIPVTIQPPMTVQEIAHGALIAADLQALPLLGPSRLYLLAQEPRTSHEVLVEATSGDIGDGQGPSVEHLAGDGQTVLAPSAAVGAGPSRSLRVVNGTAARLVDFVRVSSASCSTDCGTDDVFTLRAYETTLLATRFNNSGTQATVLVLQNSGSEAIQGEVHFWTPAGAHLASAPLALQSRQVFVLSTAAVPAVAGASGSLTVTHDGRYGSLVGKAVAIEPSTGFSFDTPLAARPR